MFSKLAFVGCAIDAFFGAFNVPVEMAILANPLIW